MPVLAVLALAAGDHRGDDHVSADPALGAPSSGHHAPADLVAQGEGKGVAGRHAVVEETQIGVADAAAGDFDGGCC